jgi:nicotinamidase-related amidase
MRHPNILDPARAALLIIDVQEAFRTIIPEAEALAHRIARLARGMQILGIPVLVTEQYPRGLGTTVHEISEALAPGTFVAEKTAFSSCGAASFAEHLDNLGRDQVVVCGIEAHICVNQTTHDLLHSGRQVHLAVDCIDSRFPWNRKVAVRKMLNSGALLTTTEMAFFELMRDAKHEHFKAVQALIK